MRPKIREEDGWLKSRKPSLYLMIGIPGSGKSTWARENSTKIGQLIPLDVIRKEIYGYFPSELNEELESKVWSKAIKSASNCLNGNINTIIDSMALTKAFRKYIFEEIDKLTIMGYSKVAVYLRTPLIVALNRNRKREKFVEEETIQLLSGAIEPPDKEEGFERIIIIG